MMSKSFSFSPLISGKTYGAIQNVSNHSVRDGGQLKMFSTSLTCSQLYPSTCVLAAKLTCIGTRSCRFVSLLQRRGSNSADVKPLNQLAAAPFSLFGLNRVVCYHSAFDLEVPMPSYFSELRQHRESFSFNFLGYFSLHFHLRLRSEYCHRV